MILPYLIESFKGVQLEERWNSQFVETDRTFFEGLWRRTQEKNNSKKSGWRSDSDSRVKILYFVDEYNLANTNIGGSEFYLKAPYLWLFLGIPKNETDSIKNDCLEALSDKWQYDLNKKIYKNGDLTFRLTIRDNPPNIIGSRQFPNNYNFLEVTLSSRKTKISKEKLSNPWSVFKTGIRKPLQRGEPLIMQSITEISRYLPFQVELGCGPSIEAGIPPLHDLHYLYDVSDAEGKFIFGGDQFTLLSRILKNPEEFYSNSSFSYRTALTTKPTLFYRLLRKLKDVGHLVGPVITNNFDGLAKRVGLEENFIRRYEELSIVPDFTFDNQAKSLLVVGSHADRRRIQEKARLKGLIIIYIDPEGYSINGKARPFPLESPQSNDLLYRITAQAFAEEYSQSFRLQMD